MKNFFGTSLIEILIAIAIIAIISAVALPAYSHYLTRTNRFSAEVTLEKLATLLEQYNIQNNTYQNATLEKLNIVAPNNYQLEIVSATDTQFVIAALPLDAQAKNDTQCATLSLDSHNVKSITGTGTVEECW